MWLQHRLWFRRWMLHASCRVCRAHVTAMAMCICHASHDHQQVITRVCTVMSTTGLCIAGEAASLPLAAAAASCSSPVAGCRSHMLQQLLLLRRRQRHWSLLCLLCCLLLLLLLGQFALAPAGTCCCHLEPLQVRKPCGATSKSKLPLVSCQELP